MRERCCGPSARQRRRELKVNTGVARIRERAVERQVVSLAREPRQETCEGEPPWKSRRFTTSARSH